MTAASPGSLFDRLRPKPSATGGSALLDRGRIRPAEVVFWIAAILVFFVFRDNLAFAASVLTMAIFTMSLDLVIGFAGIISLGHALFFGIGAYVAALAALHGWHEPISGALLGGVAGALVAAATGIFVLRLREMPLIMVTLALNVIAYEAANKAIIITNGDDGLFGIIVSPLLGLFRWSLYSQTAYLYVLGWAFLLFVLARRIVSSPFGVALQGIRENRRRMALIGTPVIGKLLHIYVISGFMAGVAGALSAQTTNFVGLTVISLDVSISALVMLVLGGTGRLYGALIGTIVYMIVQHVASLWNPYYWMLIIGLLLVGIVMFARGGILGLGEALARRLRKSAA